MTCRKRHLKCDEIKPVCGPCGRVSRQCSYSQSSSQRDSVEHVEQSVDNEATEEPSTDLNNSSAAYFSSMPEADTGNSPSTSSPHEQQNSGVLSWTTSHSQPPLHPLDQLAAIVAIDHTTSPFGNGLTAPQYPSDIPHSVTSSIESPGPTINAATVRWFDLLASDAVRESPQISSAIGGYGQDILEETDASHITPLQRATRIVDRTHIEEEELRPGLSAEQSTPNLNSHAVNSPASIHHEERLWQSQEQIQLLPHEYSLFENFVQRVSPWIDLFDPTNKFSTFVPHLAV